MKIVLATGIYPPEIGGPATYVKELAAELTKKRYEVVVVTYSRSQDLQFQTSGSWEVIRVPKGGGPLVRWWQYAKVLRKVAHNAHVVEAFSSVSAGMPIAMAGLKGPKRVLRLGGDFFWERYTGRGGLRGLREWYERKRSWPPFAKASGGKQLLLNTWLLNKFDHIIFSTEFQQKLYEKHYEKLPNHSVIQNALPSSVTSATFKPHEPFRALYMGRFVGFKNLPALVKSMELLDNVTLTLAGHGPVKFILKSLSRKGGIKGQVEFSDPKHGAEKKHVLAEHDLLVIPSVTEISPNIALEARSLGMPVLLTKETGLSEELTQGMILRDLLTPPRIADAVKDVVGNYDKYAEESSKKVVGRSWEEVANDHVELFSQL